MKQTIALFETHDGNLWFANKETWNSVAKDTCWAIKTVFVEVDDSSVEALKMMSQEDFVEIVQTFIDETPNALHSN